ncbi:MAG: hypothetical protein N4A63_14370 [Vallitalea sp.]|nr:hypothetical protein [Vallitalea sp.]
MLLKRFTLVIELLDKTVVEASYKDFKLIVRAPKDVILVYNRAKEKSKIGRPKQTEATQKAIKCDSDCGEYRGVVLVDVVDRNKLEGV